MSLAISAVLAGGGIIVPCITTPTAAYATTSQTDVILGETVQKRGDAADAPDISAPSSIMVDSDGITVYERNADEQRKIASTTKIMTVYLAVSKCAKSMDDKVTITSQSTSVGGSTSGLRTGDTVTLKGLLSCAMLPSGNDAADAIARYVGAKMDPSSSDPYATFVQAMNDTAKSLGMENTVYRNPHGLDTEQYAGDQHSTARDLSKLVATAMKDDTFKATVSQKTASVSVTHADGTTGTLNLTNTDDLLGSYAGAIGVKTGTTPSAGSCFVGAMNDGTKEIYTVVLGGSGHDQTMTDTKTLYDWAKAHDETYNVAKGYDGVTVRLNGERKELPVMAKVSCTDWTDKTVDAVLADWSPLRTYDTLGDVSQHVSLKTLTGDVHAGDKVGKVTYTQNGKTIATRELVAAKDVDAPSDLQKVVIAIGRLTRTVRGEQTCAASKVIEARSDAKDDAFTKDVKDDVAVKTRKNTNREPSTDVTIEETDS